MSQSTIARRYARAAIKNISSDDLQMIDQVKDELNAFAKAITESEELAAMTRNPAFSQAERHAVIEAIVTENKMSDLTKKVLMLLNSKGRLEYAAEVADAFVKEADVLMNRVRVTITTAKALDESTLAKVVGEIKAQTGREVVVETQLDASLIGGIRTELAGQVYDGSVAGRLDRLERNLLK